MARNRATHGHIRVRRAVRKHLGRRVFPFHRLAATWHAAPRERLEELERRVSYEEDAFAAKRRGTVVPDDYFAGGQVKSAKRAAKPNGGRQAQLFSEREE